MKTVDISGMGGSYELACQAMLLRGMAYLAQNPNFKFDESYKTYKGIYGVCVSQTEQAKTLDEVITKDIGCTGAMHQAVIGHLFYIHNNGYYAWLDDFKDEPGRIYEIDRETLEQELNKEIMLHKEKVAKGYDPLQKLRDLIPEDNRIEVNPNDPESLGEAIGKIIKAITDAEGEEIQ